MATCIGFSQFSIERGTKQCNCFGAGRIYSRERPCAEDYWHLRIKRPCAFSVLFKHEVCGNSHTTQIFLIEVAPFLNMITMAAQVNIEYILKPLNSVLLGCHFPSPVSSPL